MDKDARTQTFDEMLRALEKSQRRKLLRALLVQNPTDAESIVAAATDSADEEHRRFAQMRHKHLPILEQYGFITWNRDTNEVSKGPAFAELRPLLELLVDHEDELPVRWI